MDRRITPPKRVTSPIWGTPPSCKQALRSFWKFHLAFVQNNGKEMYKLKKVCCTRAKLLLLIRPVVVFHRFLALHAFGA